MKINIDERAIKIIDHEILYTGNVKTYIVDIEYENPKLFEEFACYIVFTNQNVSRKEHIGPDFKVKIPSIVLEEEGDLIIGFFAVRKANDGTLERYSSEIDILTVEQGAYNRHASTCEDLTPTLLEKYTIEMKKLYDKYILELSNVFKDANDLNVETKALKISIEESEKNAKLSEVNSKESEKNSKEYLEQLKDIANSIPYASFELNIDTGELTINSPERFGNMGFELNENGELEVEIGG